MTIYLADNSWINFDVSAFKGQTVRIEFLGTEDSSLQTSFFIDDVMRQIPDHCHIHARRRWRWQ